MPSARDMERAREVFYILCAYFARRKFGVNLQIKMNVEEILWHIIVQIPGQ